MSEPKTFPITTLRDIFNLPTYEQMEKCLAEMVPAMLQARAAADMMLSTAKALGAPPELTKVVEWPEVAKWTDDTKGEINLRFGGPELGESITITSKLKDDLIRQDIEEIREIIAKGGTTDDVLAFINQPEA